MGRRFLFFGFILFLIFLQFDANPLCRGEQLCVIFITQEQLYLS